MRQQFDYFGKYGFERLTPMQNIPKEMLDWKIKINTNSKNNINQLIIK